MPGDARLQRLLQHRFCRNRRHVAKEQVWPSVDCLRHSAARTPAGPLLTMAYADRTSRAVAEHVGVPLAASPNLPLVPR
jgi:hypothetical protein